MPYNLDYYQDSVKVPNFYNRPAPGSYDVEKKIKTGRKSAVSQFTNAPLYSMNRHYNHSRITTIPLQKFVRNNMSKTRFSKELIGVEKMGGFLNPSHERVVAKVHQGEFTLEPRKDPFPVNPDHIVTVQFLQKQNTSSMKQIMVICFDLTFVGKSRQFCEEIE